MKFTSRTDSALKKENTHMSEKDELFSKISYSVIEEIAPDETLLYDDLKEAYMKNPEGFQEVDLDKKEKMLGFAIPTGVKEVFTIFVLPIVEKILNKYLEKGKKFDSETLTQIRKDAYDTAIMQGLEAEKAGILADALVGKMALIG